MWIFNFEVESIWTKFTFISFLPSWTDEMWICNFQFLLKVDEQSSHSYGFFSSWTFRCNLGYLCVEIDGQSSHSYCFFSSWTFMSNLGYVWKQEWKLDKGNSCRPPMYFGIWNIIYKIDRTFSTPQVYMIRSFHYYVCTHI